MRELKFRAWDEEKKRMLYSTESYDYGNTEFRFIDGELCVVRYRCGWNNFPIAEKAKGIKGMMQYTGLKDKNGKEIYEGDILSWREHVRMYGTDLNKWVTEKVPVRFDDTGAMFLCGDDFLFKYNEKAEVIGNIYENPELLEVEKV
ncbi:YopX family protein [Aneurinibacillus thermoaerophilus]|uniref:Phage uncharacterized protein TIGR01671 n=1 Tax=Aneurinibacillus thermoaerophilus TaxID=143495 RepID=A0A1G8FSH0_ANETH|nr:YopX family protein [Aneurinibacillus thermoaerophilus]MED0759150.1 YopX family protein [Aneurinibacillus thermoaerophilus]MED0759406.1 YopX family protein [Aneurinibacillus thermoaerophilus]SDH85099.1 phage uncharacterized protein TIGR01671 [Aneurinibacillus thermoaerophilus]